MAERKSNAINVRKTNGGEICIEWDSGSEDTVVIVTAGQAEQVCKWIMEVAYEIELDQIPKAQDA